MTNHVCSETIYGATCYSGIPCGRTGKFEVNGKWYCGIHNPNKAKTKAQIRAEYDRKIRIAKAKLQKAANEYLIVQAANGEYEAVSIMDAHEKLIQAAEAKKDAAL